MPSGVLLRQRLDAKSALIREHTDELSLRLLQRSAAPITAHQGFVCCDIDTFAMDNSGTKKEAVLRTYQGFDGYTPIAAYLGNEGWNIGLELRPGSRHSAFEPHHFYERMFARIVRLVPAPKPSRIADCAPTQRATARQERKMPRRLKPTWQNQASNPVKRP